MSKKPVKSSDRTKPWYRHTTLIERLEAVRQQKETFLILCEGEKTEPNYIRGFRLASATINVLGLGYNTVSLVTEAIRIRDVEKSRGINYDQVWCVFDKDDFSAEIFNNAVELAKANNIELAYSNEAFELWYLLHFIYFDSQIGRADYIKALSKHLSNKYQKNSTDMYEELLDKQDFALANADKLFKSYDQSNPANENPCTTVYELVAELNKYIK